jgi:succinate-acetate transporter protein
VKYFMYGVLSITFLLLAIAGLKAEAACVEKGGIYPLFTQKCIGVRYDTRKTESKDSQ